MRAVYSHYGGIYTHDVNMTTFRYQTENVVNPRTGNVAFELRTVMMQGTLKESTQSAIRDKIDLLQGAYANPGYTWEFWHDDNSTSSHKLQSELLQGYIDPKIIVFPESNRNEYATQRKYAITLEATYKLETLTVLEFQEQVTITGSGGPRYVALEAVNSSPIIQQLTNQTKVTATQSGYAIGIDYYPDAPLPLFPYPINDSLGITRVSPQRKKNHLTRHRTNWNYQFISTYGLFGYPNA